MPKKEKIVPPQHHLQTGNDLPPGYKPQWAFELLGSWQRLLGVNLLAALTCGVVAFGLLFYNLLTQPNLRDAIVGLATLPVPLVMAENLGMTVFFYALHELVHGLGLYIYTRTRPRMGFHLFYFTVAEPGWYLPRGDALVTTLAPLLVVTTIGLLLFRVMPLDLTMALIFGIAMNAASSVGDLLAALWILRRPSKVLYEYLGDSVKGYYVSQKDYIPD